MHRVLRELIYQLRFGFPVWLCNLFMAWLPDVGPILRLRGWLVGRFLPGRPYGLLLGRDVTLLSVNRLSIGRNVYIAKGGWLNAIGGITLEDEVVLAPYVVMSSTNHGFKDGSVQRGGAHPASIRIGFGSWVAAHAVITAGVTVGRGNLIGANSLVSKDMPADVIVGGVPATVIKARVDNPSTVTSKHDISIDE